MASSLIPLFSCHYCGITFSRTGNTAACAKSKLKRTGRVFCSKKCGSKHRLGYAIGKNPGEFPSEYSSWNAMKSRCFDKSQRNFHRYGGRFEQPMPESWKRFDAFLDEMGPKPTPKHEIDRIDNNKPYSKENCRWATRHEQTRNRGGKRATRLYTYKGKTLCIKDWADLCGVAPQSMQKRLNVGWPLERAFKEAPL